LTGGGPSGKIYTGILQFAESSAVPLYPDKHIEGEY
jgi:hypothetical protein